MLVCLINKESELSYFLNGKKIKGKALTKAKLDYKISFIDTESLKPPVNMKEYDKLCEEYPYLEIEEKFFDNKPVAILTIGLLCCIGYLFYTVLVKYGIV